MVKVDKLFFELLQVALGNRDRLSVVPSAEEWAEIYAESERQAVSGVLLHGIERLKNADLHSSTTGDACQSKNLNQMLLLEWIGVGQMIEQWNQVMDERCLDLLKRLSDYGLQGVILKGQGIARLYNFDLNLNDKLDKKGDLGRLRQSGDIDVYVDCGLRKALEFAESLGQKNVEWDYKHLHLKLWDDTEVEMHYHVEVLLNLWKNRKLQKWFREHQNAIFNVNDNLDLNSNTDRTNDTNRFVTPTVEFNVFYILLHIYRHFLYEGVGFRQVIDYYFVLKKFNLDVDLDVDLNLNESYAYKAVREFGMTRFARGLMWVMREVLGMPREWMLWEPDEKEGRYILEQVMMGGNFGHHDERLKHSGGKLGAVKAILTHNMHLLTHYPEDVVWAPVWIVWHKLWKLTRR